MVQYSRRAPVLLLATATFGLATGTSELQLQSDFIVVNLRRRADLSAYLAEINVGTPPQKQLVKIDTGSPTYSFLDPRNALCSSAGSPCQLYGTFDNLTSLTSRYAGPGFNDLLIDYGSGDYLQDNIVIAGRSIPSAYFGYISSYPFPSHVPSPTTTIAGMSLLFSKDGPNYATTGPWLLPQLKTANVISSLVVSFYLGPDSTDDTGSHMVMGPAYDKAKIEGPRFTVPMVDPYNEELSNGQTNSVNVTSVECAIDGNVTSATFGEQNVGRPVLLDTGSPTFYIPEPIFSRVYDKLGSPTQQNRLFGYYVVTCRLKQVDDVNNFVTVHFGAIGKIVVPFSRLITQFSDGTCGAFVASGGTDLTRGFGDPFLRSTYVTFDMELLTVALAQVKYTEDQSISLLSH